MTVLDANLLLYAYDTSSAFHAEARAWIEGTFSSGDPVGLPWQTIGAFVRITTNRAIPGERFSVEEAVEIVDEWLWQPNVRVLAQNEDCWPLLRQMLTEGQAAGSLVTDAQLAALTMQYGGVLHSTDRDFARFPGLRWKNPLEKSAARA